MGEGHSSEKESLSNEVKTVPTVSCIGPVLFAAR